MRQTYTTIGFEFTNLPGWPTGPAQRGILHTDGNPNPHTALGALNWGNRERAFSIHYYVEGTKVYQCIDEEFQAFHAKESRMAAQGGWPVTWPGMSGSRGDVLALGIEHIMNPDGSWSQDTRLTSVLLGADIQRRLPKIDWSEHGEWDPWQRPNDVGNALYIPDWKLDVLTVLAGKEPFRVVGPFADGTPHTGPAPNPNPSVPLTPEAMLADHERRITALE